MNDLAHVLAGKALCATRYLDCCAPVEVTDCTPFRKVDRAPRGETPKGPGRGVRGVSITIRRDIYG